MIIETEAVIIEKPFTARFDKVKVPVPKHHNLIIEVGLCGICTPEQRVFKGTSKKNYPYWGGHELFGNIKEVLSPTSNFKKGDRIIIALMNRCGNCIYCKNGLDNHCAYVNYNNEYIDSFHGPRGLSRIISIPDYKAFHAPTELLPQYLSLIEPTACVLRSIRCSTPINKNIGVIGSGTMGLIHSILLKTLGYNIFVFDDRKDDLDKARKIPVTETLPLSYLDKGKIFELTNGNGISTFFCTRYGKPIIEKVIKCINRGGEIILFQSIPTESKLLVDLNFLHYHEIKLIGTIAQSQEDFHDSIFLMKNHFSLFDCLLIKKMTPDNPSSAFEQALGLDINRVQVDFNQVK